MRPSRGVLGWLPWWWLTACVASHPEAPTAVWPAALTPGSERPALDRLLTQGNIQVAEARLKDFGFDPGPIWPPGVGTVRSPNASRAETWGGPTADRLARVGGYSMSSVMTVALWRVS
jgi:hypothetical protein